jgi:hypothetical protein
MSMDSEERVTVELTREESHALLSVIGRGKSLLPWRRKLELSAFDKINAALDQDGAER